MFEHVSKLNLAQDPPLALFFNFERIIAKPFGNYEPCKYLLNPKETLGTPTNHKKPKRTLSYLKIQGSLMKPKNLSELFKINQKASISTQGLKLFSLVALSKKQFQLYH